MVTTVTEIVWDSKFRRFGITNFFAFFFFLRVPLCHYVNFTKNLSKNIEQRRLISFREERDENIILILGGLFFNLFVIYLTIHFFC